MDVLSPMSALRSEYENGSAMFLKQIDWLVANGYNSIRRTRGEAPLTSWKKMTHD